jgi:hypothetical protein
MRQELLFIVVLHVQILNHFVFVLNVVFNLVDVVRSLAEVPLLGPVEIIFSFLGGREDVFDRVGGDEIFVRFEAMHRPFVGSRNSVFLVAAVVGEVTD